MTNYSILDLVNSQRNNGAQTPPMNPQIQQIKQMMNRLRAMQNPQDAFLQMAANNPLLQQAILFVKNNGGDAQTAFYNYAKQMGVDPQEVLNMLR